MAAPEQQPPLSYTALQHVALQRQQRRARLVPSPPTAAYEKSKSGSGHAPAAPAVPLYDAMMFTALFVPKVPPPHSRTSAAMRQALPISAHAGPIHATLSGAFASPE